MENIALVTAVSRSMGLGYETAKQLASLGYKVVITARDISKVSELAGKSNLYPMQLDVTDDASTSELVKNIDKQFKKLDVLINNAGGFFDQGGQAIATDLQFVREALDLNLLGAWRVTKAFLPLLRKSAAGRIVNISSGAASFTDPIFGLNHHQGNVPAYSISKLALNGLTVKLARELGNTSIKVNAVCPGFVATYPGTEQWGARPVEDGAKGIVWAATLPEDGPTGEFFRDGKALSW